MKLIVGLGNIGSKYDNTYHNVGFATIDMSAEALNVTFSKKGKNSNYAVGKDFVLAKPTTYMNLSGKAVTELMQKFKIKPTDVLVVFDDYDLLSGTIKHKLKGSGGTHNGAKDIVLAIGQDFERVKIGIKPDKDFCPTDLADFVLSKISEAEKPKIEQGIKTAVEEIVKFANR